MTEDLEYKLKLTKTGDGARQAERELDGVGKTAKKAGQEATGAMGKLTRAAEEANRKMSTLRKVMSLGGVGAALGAAASSVMQIVSAVGEWIHRQRQLTGEIQRGNASSAWDRAAEAHRRVTDALREEAEQQGRASEIERIRLDNLRRLEDARLAAAEESEISADPAREKEIRARYAVRRARLSSGRAEEDVLSAETATRREADAADARAEALRARKAELEGFADEYAAKAASSSAAGNNALRGWLIWLPWQKTASMRYAAETQDWTGRSKAARGEAGRLGDEIARLEASSRDLRLAADAIRTGLEPIRVQRLAAESSGARAVKAAVGEREAARAAELLTRAKALSGNAASLSKRYAQAARDFAPRRGDYAYFGDWNRARIRDRALDDQAAGSDRLARSAAHLTDTLQRMRPDELAAAFDRLNEQLKSLDRAIGQMKDREKTHK